MQVRQLRGDAMMETLKNQQCPRLPATLAEVADRIDPWGRPIVVMCDAEQAITVRSAGEDGVLGTRDDVVLPD